ncbi:hypothetical protein WA026_008766 [Henosepilachna vigintioctopunctata]|uniref:Short-chain dehydrogenase/reductase 3 n=1 Tax=Henosepilachna vigintioctopunctata TaxID=420089 RepID=A0AAW1VB62_9CUCU
MTPVRNVNGSVDSNVKQNRSPHISEVIIQLFEILCLILVWSVQSIYFIGESLFKMVFQPQPRSVEGEIVLITGTGHGIGKELALKYAEAGATVVAWDVNKKNNDGTVKEINQKYQKKAHGYICDVGSRDSILEVAKKVQQEVGDVTILIANAGIMPCHLIEEHSADEIRKTIDVNVMQLFWLLEAFLPAMKKNNHGHIVGISSIAGIKGFKNVVPYCTSKFAVRGLLESLREELRADRRNRIGTTSIFPYMVNTGLITNPRIKFEFFMKMLSASEVAECIMMAQRRNEVEASLPSFLMYFQTLMRLLPYNAMAKLVDLLDSGIDTESIEETK